MSAALILADDLRVHFPTGKGGETVKAVDGVSFAVWPGETFGVIGESGSGKSTLVRALVMLLKPTSGTLRLHGGDPYALGASAFRTLRRDYQVVFQDPNAALNPRMTIGDSVREPLDILGVLPSADRRRRVARCSSAWAWAPNTRSATRMSCPGARSSESTSRGC